jgi:type I restriction enzyme, S subunit
VTFPKYPEYKDSGVEWLEEVPAHWEVKPLKSVATCNDEVLREDASEDYELAYVEISDVDAERGITNQTICQFGQAPSRARRRVRHGDVLVSTVRTYLRAISPVVDPPANMIASTGFAVIRPSPRHIHWRALGYLVRAEWFVAEVISRSVGVSYPAINASDLMHLHVPVAPPDEQERIAAFLDHETARIDALVEEQKRLIELLKEKRQAVISHAVTKGLDPNVPMKDSGVEWLGEVPAHWEVKALSRITVEKTDGPFGSGLKSNHYTDSGARVVRLQNIRRGWFDGSDSAYVSLSYFKSELTRHHVLGDDLLVAGLGDDKNPVGRACVAPQGIGPALVKADCFRFRLNRIQALPSFVALQLSAGAEADSGHLATGSTRSRISLSAMATRQVSLPPLDEQEAIVTFLQGIEDAHDELLQESMASIDLMTEHRSALISAAVTGKIDVRGWKSPTTSHTTAEHARESA